VFDSPKLEIDGSPASPRKVFAGLETPVGIAQTLPYW
jgi:hypothetical protein